MNSPQPPIHGTRFVRLATLFYGLALTVAAGIAALRDHSLWYRDAGAAEGGVDWLLHGAVGVVAAVLVIAISALLTEHTRWGRGLAAELAALLGPLTTGQCLALALLSGLGEEALFRGALQPWLGLWPASLLFGLAHFAPSKSLAPWTLFAFAAGLFLGALYEWTGNLLAPIVAHAGINAVNLRLLARAAERAD